MKNLLFASMLLLSFSTYAGQYDCDIKVYENKCTTLSADCSNPLVGEIKFTQEIGASMGYIHLLPIVEKKNILGKRSKTVNLVVAGLIQYSGELDGNSLLDLYVYLETTTFKRRISSTTLDLARIQGQGTQLITEVSENFVVRGGCTFTANKQ